MVAKAIVATCITAIAMQASAPAKADWDWLNEHRDAAFESLMPVGPPSSPLVAYRSYRDLYQDVQERYFRIEFAGGLGVDRDRLTATVVVPQERSIQQQLLDAHIKNRQAPFDSVLAFVAVRRLTLSAEKCPAVRTQADALSTTHVSLPDRDNFFVHPVLHRIVINMMATRMDATVEGPDNPIVRWATETLQALLACAG